MLSYIVHSGFEKSVTAIILCDWPGCRLRRAADYPDELMLSEVSALAIADFTDAGWKIDHPVPVSERNETEMRPGHCCPECQKR